MSRKRGRARSAGLSPRIRHVIAAARSPVGGSSRSGEAAALAGLARVAMICVAVHGVLAPTDSALVAAIGAIADRHLGQRRADRRFRRALRLVKAFAVRDAIDFAHSDALHRTATTYYYAGLAWGLSWVETRGGRS